MAASPAPKNAEIVIRQRAAEIGVHATDRFELARVSNQDHVEHPICR